MPTEVATVDAVVAAEMARAWAISNNDYDALAELLDDDLTYTHSNGHTEGKCAVIEGHRLHARTVDRERLEVRIVGDVAVMTGGITLTFPPDEPGAEPSRLNGTALQVWTSRGDCWRLLACQVTRDTSAA